MSKITSVKISNDPKQFDEIRLLIEQEGAVILRGIITKETAQKLKQDLNSSLDEDLQQFGDNYIFKGMVHALMNRKKSFVELLDDKNILGIFRSILGKGAILHAYNSSSMPPALTNFSRSIHVDCPRLIPGYITNMGITIAVDAFTPTNGAMEIWPSSFTQMTAPSEENFVANKVDLDDLEIGDAILFNARCWHRGGINKTNDWRHAVTMNVCRAYMRQQFDFSELMGEEKIDTLSEDVKQFIGYNVRMPHNMEEFLLPADKRKYKAGQE
ncbi:MAG: phytanoyl-CoA dioxygenase family protein [Ferruginibacter sp.]